MLKITFLGGNCPVQADGTIDGVPFYFRARGAHWSMAVGDDPVGIICGYKDGWKKVEEWGEWPQAGWMSREAARELIEKAAEEYRNSC